MILPREWETTCIKRKLSSSWEILKEPLRGTNFLFCGRDSSRFTRKRYRLKTITSRHIFWSGCHKMYRKRYEELPHPFCMEVPTRPSFVTETIFFKVHLTPKLFFGRDETVQYSHKEFDNLSVSGIFKGFKN